MLYMLCINKFYDERGEIFNKIADCVTINNGKITRAKDTSGLIS